MLRETTYNAIYKDRRPINLQNMSSDDRQDLRNLLSDQYPGAGSDFYSPITHLTWNGMVYDRDSSFSGVMTPVNSISGYVVLDELRASPSELAQDTDSLDSLRYALSNALPKVPKDVELIKENPIDVQLDALNQLMKGDNHD